MMARMNTIRYDLGRASDLDRERPSMADLQRAQAHALRVGDRRRAAAYGLVVRHRLEAAQRAASSRSGRAEAA
jgi:hypothetical protein